MNNFLEKYEIKKYLKNYSLLSIKPAILGIFAVVVWSKYFSEEYRARPEDSEVITAVLGMFLFFSTFIVVMTVTWTSKQFSRMRSAVGGYYENSNEEKRKEKYKKFKKNLKKKIPAILNFVIFVAVALAIMASMLLPYHRYDIGVFCVFGVTFLHVLCFFVAIELDDPTKRCWLLNVPPEWLIQLSNDRKDQCEGLEEVTNENDVLRSDIKQDSRCLGLVKTIIVNKRSGFK